jgi:hypothetical protein
LAHSIHHLGGPSACSGLRWPEWNVELRRGVTHQ